MSYFSVPNRWRIPADALRHSFTEMAQDGIRGCEGIAMWLGHYDGDDTAVITHVALLRGPGVQKAPDRLLITADLVNDITDIAIENKLTLIGQIHSHGPLYGVDLSVVDRRAGIVVPGYLSAVAPDYALRSSTTLEECGIHVYSPAQGWQRLSPQDVREQISIVDGVHVPVLIAGAEK
jgi:hypothetical protein